MVNSLVDRATSEHLTGPDWDKNLEIIDICNRNAAQAKEAVKGIKKRLQSRCAKVQLLTLILLDALVKNCGDVVHDFVVNKDLLYDMVKIAKKKSDFRVKEKILILIDSWQEALGGARAKHSQFFAAYLDLLKTGLVFPQRTENAPSKLEPDKHKDVSGSPSGDKFPILSSTEIKNAQCTMDVLAEMINVLKPKNKKGLDQAVIVDLVAQCRSYKQRAVHLVNSTSDEFLLRQGLALNDELQHLLAKYEGIASGNVAVKEVETPLIDTGDNSQHPNRSNSDQVHPIQIDPKMDLLSFDNYTPPSEETSPAAIVTSGAPQQDSPIASSQNALALIEMFPNHHASYMAQEYPSTSQYQQQQRTHQSNPHPIFPQYDQQPSLYIQGSNNNTIWNGQIPQPSSPIYGNHTSSWLPPPPYHPPIQVTQVIITNSHPMPNQAMIFNQGNHNHLLGLPTPPTIQTTTCMYSSPQIQVSANQNQHHQMTNGYGYGYGYGYEHRQQQNMNPRSSSYQSPSPSIKTSNPEDKLFGDLIDLT